MDIGIVTFHREPNYGAVLQAYALQEFLLQLGYDAGIYDYIRPQLPQTNPKQRLIDAVCRLSPRDRRSRDAKFDSFRQSYLRCCSDARCAAYVAGSDQIWNPGGALDETYFLTFAPESAKKLSYAASLGEAVIPDSQRDTIRRLLSDFDAISVREADAAACISALCGRAVSLHADPTLLHDKMFWRSIASPVDGIGGAYILVYLMHLPKNINRLLRWLKKETGYEIVLLDGQGAVQGPLSALVTHDKAVHRAGPREFVWLADHAECIVTSSFHGTVFSIIFEKECYAVTQPQDTRMTQLRQTFGFHPLSETQRQFVRGDAVDEKTVSVIQRGLRDEARHYFEGVLM